MKLFSYAAITTTYRHLSTKITQSTKLTRDNFKNKNQNKRKNPKNHKRTKKVEWTDQQLQVLDEVSNGKSVFISGSAGTGKTILVKHIIKQLKRIHGPSRVFATASTGVAACPIYGQTLHSFAGIGLGEADCATLLDRVVSSRKAYRRWMKVKALVIDEMSMIDADYFDKIKSIANKVREMEDDYRGWGGIQLIASGDFFQLPPVNPVTSQLHSRPKRFAFEADCWDSSYDLQVELKNIFRQSDPQLIKLLQGIRRGETDPEDLQLLEQRCSGAEPDPSVVSCYPRREDVDRVNQKHMESLGREAIVYRAVDSGKDPWKRQLSKGIAPEELKLCIGARVMLTKNLHYWKKLVNGATGTVIDFYKPDDSDDDMDDIRDNSDDDMDDVQDNSDDDMDDIRDTCDFKMLPIVKFDSGAVVNISPKTWVVMDGEKVVANRRQIPLILAWALSIHKCQGMAFDSIHTDLSRAFDFGMVYVALSRVKTLDGLHLSGFDASKIKAHPKVLQFYQCLASEHEDKLGEEYVANKNCSISSSKLLDMANERTKQYDCSYKFR